MELNAITIPEGYSINGYTTDGFTFVAGPGDLMNIEGGIAAPNVPTGAVLLVVPNWGARVAGWAEGAGIDAVIKPVVALASVVVGIVFLWWAVTIAWGPTEVDRLTPNWTDGASRRGSVR